MDKETYEKVDRVMRALPLCHNAEEKIPEIIKNFPISLLLGRVNELPQNKTCTEEKATKELKVFIKKSKSLFKHIGEMHKTSLVRFDKHDVINPLYLQAQLRNLVAVAELPFDEFDVVADTNQGRSKALQAEAFAEHLAKVFLTLTGKDATRVVKDNVEIGLYAKFTEDVFNALNLDESGKSQASERFKRMYKKS